MKIFYFFIALALYFGYLLGLGSFIVLIIDVELEGVEGFNRVMCWFVIGSVPVGFVYAIYSALDFATHIYKNIESMVHDEGVSK